MSIPHADRHRMAFERALARELAAVDAADEASARRLVAAALEAAHAAAAEALVTALLVESKRRAGELEAEQAKQKADRERRERTEQEGRKALRKLFPKLHDRIELWTDYRILQCEGFLIAVPDAAAARVARGLGAAGEAVWGSAPGGPVAQALRQAGFYVEDESIVGPGIKLGKLLERYNETNRTEKRGLGKLDLVDPTTPEAVELVAAAARKREQERAAEAKRQAAANELAKRERDQKRDYGTVID